MWVTGGRQTPPRLTARTRRSFDGPLVLVYSGPSGLFMPHTPPAAACDGHRPLAHLLIAAVRCNLITDRANGKRPAESSLTEDRQARRPRRDCNESRENNRDRGVCSRPHPTGVRKRPTIARAHLESTDSERLHSQPVFVRSSPSVGRRCTCENRGSRSPETRRTYPNRVMRLSQTTSLDSVSTGVWTTEHLC